MSIQKRTSPDKFAGELGIRDFEISFAISLVLAFELTGQAEGSRFRLETGAESSAISGRVKIRLPDIA